MLLVRLRTDKKMGSVNSNTFIIIFILKNAIGLFE